MFKLLALVTLGLFLCLTNAHMSIYTPSMWGQEPDNINSNWAVIPLQDLSFNDWWFHGQKSLNDPPHPNAITSLPAGGTIDFEIGGNKAFTSMGRGLWHHDGQSPRNPPSSNPWYAEWLGQNIHSPKRTDVAGCALGIAYKSDISSVRPEDFVIMSVVKDCIARSLQAFDIPALPACPNGKCICAWFWIHNSIGGTDQMYMTGFQCNVANPSKRTIGRPVPPVRCDGKPPCYLYPNWGNTTNVCRKPLSPMYWANKEGMNMANPTNAQCAPIYSAEWGYPDGAQHQIFTDSFDCIQNVGDTLISNTNVNSISSDDGTRLASPSCYTKLTVMDDGNVLHATVNNEKTYWSSTTAALGGVAPFRLTMQNDGDLVLTDSNSTTLWTSGTAGMGCAPYSLKLRDVGKLTVVDCNGEPLWPKN